MKRRNLGSGGPSVSELGLGCMGMSQAYGTADERDEAESIRVIHRALELGTNFFDTAEVYGPYTNEELLGKALRGKRDEAFIATKFGFNLTTPKPFKVDSNPKTIRAAVEGSLKRLQIETIDLIYQHRVDPAVPIEEVVGTMADLITEGKVKCLGLSEASAATIRKAHKVHPIAAVQSEYSLWERGLEETVLPTLRELGIALVPFSPLGRGFLSGQIKSYEDLPADDFRKNDPRYMGENFQRNLDIVEEVKNIGKRHSATASQVALAWVLAQGDDMIPIPGTKRVKYLEENSAAADLVLSKEELAELDTLAGKTSGPRYNEQLMALVDKS